MTIELPGLTGLRLAVCSVRGCQWGDYVPRVNEVHQCSDHLARSRLAKSGENVVVKCLARGCTHKFRFTYRPDNPNLPRRLLCKQHGGAS